jgi:hypothetical protein
MTQGAVVGPVVIVLATAASAAARSHGARLLDLCVGAQRFWNKLAMKSNLVSFLLLSQVTKNNFLATRSRCNCQFAGIRACTTLRLEVVYRTSNYEYKQMYRQVIQPIDRGVMCKLFNVLKVA